MGKNHFNLDEINSLYSLKNILILNPANIEELEYVYKKFLKYKKPIYFRINKFNFENKFKFKRYNNFFYKKGKSTNLITSGAILNYILENLEDKEIEKLNMISLPIMDHLYNKNFENFLNKNQKTIMICDSSKTLFFEEIKSNLKKTKMVYNFDFNHNKIKKVGNYNFILKTLGLNRKNFKKLLF